MAASSVVLSVFLHWSQQIIATVSNMLIGYAPGGEWGHAYEGCLWPLRADLTDFQPGDFWLAWIMATAWATFSKASCCLSSRAWRSRRSGIRRALGLGWMLSITTS